MINGKKILAIIPARSGSKGLLGKNLKEICGKPLIAWTINQALESQYIDKVIVSTDSQQIAKSARTFGANVPFIRPKYLAEDTSKSIDVILHAIKFEADNGGNYDFVVLLEPTSPLRDVSDIDGAIKKLSDNPKIKSIVGVAKTESSHPSFIFEMNGDVIESAFNSSPNNLRRQDLRKDYYYLEGSIYVSDVKILMQQKSFYHTETGAWVVDRYKAIEIDELSDFIAAEALLKAKLEGILNTN